MALKNFHRIVAETPEELNGMVEHSMDILERIHELLMEKFDGRQKLLAEKLGKSEAEVSKMVNGVQNFTLKTIAKLEWAFGAKIIAVCTNVPGAVFTPVKMPAEKGFKRITLTEKNIDEGQSDRLIVKLNSLSASKTTYSAS